MKRYALILKLGASVWLSVSTATYAGPPVEQTYPSDVRTAVAIGNDLYDTLEPQFQRTLNPETVFVQRSQRPMIAPILGRRGFRGQVSVSTGFVDLLNHIAHAKAIDRIEPGYFSRYVAMLTREGAEENPPAPPNLDNPRFWSDRVMNDQASMFNQMISMTMAMNLTHLYLPHYTRHAGEMPPGQLMAINEVIGVDEWKESVKYAAQNSLDCALAAGGMEALFECIDQMPHRPAWAAEIVPQGVDLKELNRQLSRIEHNYFRGRTLHGTQASRG